jgi:hypothetical protein
MPDTLRFSFCFQFLESLLFLTPCTLNQGRGFSYNAPLMDKIIVTLSPEHEYQVEMGNFPELASENKLVRQGIGILKQYTPGVLRYLSMQRLLAHLPAYLIEVQGAEGMPETEVRRRLGNWMRRKRNRRLLYVVMELLLLPFTAFVAILPGPNVAFYGLFVLLYFHFKAFLSLSRIKAENLNISLQRS